MAERHHLIAPVMEQPQYNLLTRGKLGRSICTSSVTMVSVRPSGRRLPSGSCRKIPRRLDEDTRLKMKGLEWLREQSCAEEVMTKVKALKSLAENAKPPCRCYPLPGA